MNSLPTIATLLLLMLLLPACGQEPSQPGVDISMTSIVWQGYANEDPILLQKFNDTMKCLDSLNVPMIQYPYVIIVKDPFLCGTDFPISGCAIIGENKMYITNPWSFKHEVIHLATGLGIEAEDSVYFSQCEWTETGR